MGRHSTEDMLNYADLDTTLEWHLKGNHFPPVHSDFIPSAKKAIEHVNSRQGQTPITMPNGITKTAYEIVEGLHLDAFLDDDLANDNWI